MLRIKRSSIPVLLALVVVITASTAAILLYKETREAEALTRARLKGVVELARYRMTYTDIINAPIVDGDPSRRRVTLTTMSGGDQILSIVTKVTTPFLVPSNTFVFGEKLVAEQAGVQVSVGDLALPANFQQIGFYNGLGNSNTVEFMFYSESLPTDIVVTIKAEDGSNLSTLTQGQADFYILQIQ